MMKIEDIKTIVELMSTHDLSEFRIESNDTELTIVRGAKNPIIVQSSLPVTENVVPSVAAASNSAPVSQPAAPVVSTQPITGKAVNTIKSPMVGTFYRSSSPDSAPFIKVGDEVKPDTVVCIIEAMKVMNEIKAETSGIIKEVICENSQPVEYGQPLFILE